MHMTDETKGKGNLILTIQFQGEPNPIPKHIELFDTRLNRVDAIVTSHWTYRFNDLIEGTYLVRVSLPSGAIRQEVIDVAADEDFHLTLDVSSFSPHETHEWAYFSKNKPFDITRMMSTPMYITASLLSFRSGTWISSPFPQLSGKFIDGIGETVTFDVGSGLHVLEITARPYPPCRVCLPPGKDLHCLVKLSPTPVEIVGPLDITIATRNWEEEALLTWLSKGDVPDSNVSFNSHYYNWVSHILLTYDDIETNPTLSLLLGYCRLITDGSRKVIYSIQLLKLPDAVVLTAWFGIATQTTDYNSLKTLLLETIAIGIPIYTEGLRLLFEGLNMLSAMQNHQDKEVEKALRLSRTLLSACDPTKQVSTFINETPQLQAHFATYENFTPYPGHETDAFTYANA
jgi:hypothetical protein